MAHPTSVRLSDEHAAFVDSLTYRSRSAAIIACIEAVKRRPSLLDQKMTAEPPKKAKPLQPTSPVPRETRPERTSTWTRPSQDECAHPFRDNTGKCRVCGQTR